MDIRLSTPTHKFLHFDLMTNGMALFSAVLVLALISVETLRARVWATTVICLTAIAFIYPLLLPSALILAGAALAVPHALRWLANGPLMPGPAKLLAGAALVVPIAALAGNLALLSNVETASPMALAGPADIKQSLGAGLFGAIAWAPILIPALFALWRTREPKRVTLVFAAGVSAVFFLALAMPEVVNYKFLVAAFLCLLPLVAEQLIVWLERRPRLEIPVAAAGFAVVALAVAPHVTRVHVPWGIFNIAPPITEAGFIVEPAEPERLAWITAIRDRTPEDTVILHPRSLTPIEVLAQRSSYVMPGDGEDARPGYTMPAEVILEEVKGYPHAIVGPRAEVLDRVYADDPEADFSSLTTELLALGRPVAVVLPPDAPYRAWLEASGRGAALHADAEVVVWLITAPSA